MINVLIVDDEYLLRKHICNSIDWELLDMRVCGEARDGNAALQVIAEKHPDIVLTDIRMPDMNGIELSKIIHERYPEILVIIITGYGEFEYAKEAVNANVFSYLLKPVHGKEYTAVLQKARERIIKERDKREFITRAERYRDIYSRAYDLKRAVGEPHTEAEVQELLQNAKATLSPQGLAVVVVNWETLRCSMADSQHREAARDKLEGQLRAKVFSEVCSVTFENATDELVILCNMDVAQQKAIASRMEQFCISLEVEREMKMFVGMSCIGSGYDHLHSLYLQAKKASKSIFVLANCKVLIYADGEDTASSLLSQYFDSNELMVYLRQRDMEATRKYIETVMDGMTEQHATKEACIFVSLMLLSVLNKYLTENSQALEYNTNELIDTVSGKQSLEELKAFVLMLFEKSARSLPENSVMHEKVIQAKQYIAEHYAEPDLSLNSIARALFINASYLCSLFKKGTKTTIVEYIKDHRLELAKQMFDDKTDLTISEVATAIGYGDEYYFMRCFKKKYGISPRVYRRMKQTDDR